MRSLSDEQFVLLLVPGGYLLLRGVENLLLGRPGRLQLVSDACLLVGRRLQVVR